jgi:oligopeptide transport system ATP-binding protein
VLACNTWGKDEVTENLLTVEHLSKHFPARRSLSEMFRPAQKMVKAVDDVTFTIEKGMTFGLVGESGCGKTTISKVILGLYKPTRGKVLFRGMDVSGRPSKEDARLYHREIQAVFQDPAGSLDPRMTVGQIVREPLDINREGDEQTRDNVARKMVEAVGLTQEQFRRYPHELSGGQQQRVAIARALALHPKLVILDEPVSALDMSVRAQILNLLKDLQSEFELTYLFVAHDLSVVRYLCDIVSVMYLGQIVEACGTNELFENPLHPYTKALLAAVPVPDPNNRRIHEPLSGTIPSPLALPSGCRFHTRCPSRIEMCSSVEPKLIEVKPNHYVSCHLYPS